MRTCIISIDELRALREDRARWDYLDAHPCALDVGGIGDETWWQITDAAGQYHRGATVRAAIDAARAKAKAEKA